MSCQKSHQPHFCCQRNIKQSQIFNNFYSTGTVPVWGTMNVRNAQTMQPLTITSLKFTKWFKELRASIGEMCRLRRRLCRKMETNLKKKCLTSLLGRNFGPSRFKIVSINNQFIHLSHSYSPFFVYQT